jgi:hypothetical protein
MTTNAEHGTLTREQRIERYGHGPWVDEPDRVEFEAGGFTCLALRQMSSGHWCGYVAVPPGHPWHGKAESYGDDGGVSADVHGGVTYASECSGAVCHVPKPGEPDNVWWIGFDCSHAWDTRPADDVRYGVGGFFGDRDKSYKGVEFVKRQCKQLADQAAAVVVDSARRTR